MNRNTICSVYRSQVHSPIKIKEVKGKGTAFFFRKNYKGTQYDFLVTCRHVVEDTKRGMFLMHLSTGKGPSGEIVKLELNNFGERWFFHPNKEIDVAIMPFDSLKYGIMDKYKEPFFAPFPEEDILKQGAMDSLDAVEEVFFTGYPIGIYDHSTISPVTRRGITATPMFFNYNGAPLFLVDAAIFPGTSGSPVILENKRIKTTDDGYTIREYKPYLVGIVSAVFFMDSQVVISAPIPSSLNFVGKQKQMIDLGIVIKAQTITETIDAFLERQFP